MAIIGDDLLCMALGNVLLVGGSMGGKGMSIDDDLDKPGNRQR